MIKLKDIKIDVLNDSDIARLKAICKALKTKKENIINYDINKKSIDARNKGQIFYVYEFVVAIKNEDKYLSKNILKYEKPIYKLPIHGNSAFENVIIVGAGPAGLFSAYLLAENGYKPVIIERGEKIETRTNDVEEFWKTGILKPNSNVQFGEGGAGTFSDGKLNTMINDKFYRKQKVFEIFVDCGAPKEILYDYKPHIGTNILKKVIINMRNKIILMGGTFKYNSTLTNIFTKDDKIFKIEINNKEIISCQNLILAIGHSARDTFKMLYENNIKMEGKPFAVGLRISHSQKMIDLANYGEKYEHVLEKSSYKLTFNAPDKRGIYTFCMCPGGYVVNASSKDNCLTINGMSNYERESENANSAVVITINENDFGKGPLDGMKYQIYLEQKAYELGNGNIPLQLFGDYDKNTLSTKFKSVKPIFKGNYSFANLNELFTKDINNDLKLAIHKFGKKIRGFDSEDAILAGIESRTSSPVRIIRDENFESSIKGIYPCGEGAGYAGGITSAAIDGIKVVEAIIKKYDRY